MVVQWLYITRKHLQRHTHKAFVSNNKYLRVKVDLIELICLQIIIDQCKFEFEQKTVIFFYFKMLNRNIIK